MTAPTRPAVAYYRVSTSKQGASGLGLEAQQAMVLAYAHANALTITHSFKELESGKTKDRAQLTAALDQARRAGATLLIAKLDRLSRNVAFVSALMDSSVDFVAVDMPSANKLTIHIMAAMAEQEAGAISERTRAALAARKARGLTMGTPANFTPEARAQGPAVQRQAAMVAMRSAAAHARLLRERGDSLTAVAHSLNNAGFRTRQGKTWTATQVKRILERTAD